jgi:hypothetical protein
MAVWGIGTGADDAILRWFFCSPKRIAILRQVVWELFYNPSAVGEGSLLPRWVDAVEKVLVNIDES